MAFKLAEAFVRITARDETAGAVSMAKRSIGSQIGSLQQLIAAGTGALIGGAIVKGALDVAAAAEQSKVAFETILKDGEKTMALLKELDDFSVSTPFTPTEVRKAGQSLLAFRNTAAEVPEILQFLGDAAAGSGSELSELVRIFNKTKSVGKLTGETFEQFAERGVNLRVVLGEMLGKTGEEMVEMQKNGEISFDLVTQAFRKMTGEGGIFFNAMQKQSTTFSGLMSTLEGNVTKVKEQLGNALLPVAKEIVITVNNWVQTFARLNQQSNGLLGKIVLITGAVASLALAIRAASVAAQLMGTSLRKLAVASLLNPVTLSIMAIVGSIALVVAGAIKLINYLRQFKAVTNAWEMATIRIQLAWDKLKQAFQIFTQSLRMIIEKVWGPIGEEFSRFFTDMGDSFVGIVAFLIDRFSVFVRSVVNGLQVVVEQWGRAWMAMGEAMQHAIDGNLVLAAARAAQEVGRIRGEFKRLQRESAMEEERLRREREAARLRPPEAPEVAPMDELKVDKVKAEKLEADAGIFGITDLAKQMQQQELRRNDTEKKIEEHTRESAEHLADISARGEGFVAFGRASS